MSFSHETVHHPELETDIIRLQYVADDPSHSIVAEVSPHFGSNLYRFAVGDKEIIYTDLALLKDRDWTGTFVLWPIPNRVNDKQYVFEGSTVSLQDVKRKRGNESLIHGFVDDQVWQADEPIVSDDSVSVRTWIEITPESPIYRFYPYTSQLSINYVLSKEGVRIHYTVENRSEGNLPFGFALHPYFAAISGAAKTLVTLPAESVMETDEELLPSGKLLPMDDQPYDLRQPTPVGELELDHVFTDLSADLPPSIVYATENMRLDLNSSAEFTHMVLYTLEVDKGFICFENQTGSTDMINLHTKAIEQGDEALKRAAHLMILPAGESHTGYISYDISFV